MTDYISEGMTWSEVFGILNKVIDKVTWIEGAIGGALVEGRIDYAAIINKPSINGVELEGELSHEDLKIDIGSSLKERIAGIEGRTSEAEGECVSLDNRASALESFEDMYKSKVDTLEDGRTGDLGRISTLEAHRIVDASNITQLQSRVNAVDSSISSLNIQQDANNSLIQNRIENMDDVNNVIVTKINELITRTNRVASAACGAEPMSVCLQPIQQFDLENK